MTKYGSVEDVRDLYNEFKKIEENIDKVPSSRLAKIKRIISNINFAYVNSKEQSLENQANALYYSKRNEFTAYGCEVAYYIENRKTALVYGEIKIKYDKEGNLKTPEVKYEKYNEYARFLADLASKKIIYSKEFDKFIRINLVNKKQVFEVIDEGYFGFNYPVEKQQAIKDFLPALEELYREHITNYKHGYTIHQYSFLTNDFIYNVETMKREDRQPKTNELFFDHYDIKANELNFEIVKEFKEMISAEKKTLHNLNLLHAYVMRRKLGLEPAEKFFMLKDFGRTGKGLLIKTFTVTFKQNAINLDNIMSGGFERQNESLKLLGCDVAHINEARQLGEKDMRVIRPMATNEETTARVIGGNTITFKPHCVVLLDTNEIMEVGTMKANTTRIKNLSFKDRPLKETDKERRKIFAPFWEYIQPVNNETSLSSAITFLIASLDYLKECEGAFEFEDVTLKNYDNAEKLSDTQIFMLEALNRTSFVLASDETLQNLLNTEYGAGGLRNKQAKQDFKSIGIRIGQRKKIDGVTCSTHVIENEDLFKSALKLILDED